MNMEVNTLGCKLPSHTWVRWLPMPWGCKQHRTRGYLRVQPRGVYQAVLFPVDTALSLACPCVCVVRAFCWVAGTCCALWWC